MCGITGILSIHNNVFEKILHSLKVLENRGYDSVGIGTLNYANFEVCKVVGQDSLDKLQERTNNWSYNIGIGHTRWATHGAKNETNCHPHIDNTKSIMLVHNGIINNYDTLKDKLMNEYDITFYSQTDSEIIANLIGIHYAKTKDIKESIIHATSLLEGTWALVILCNDYPDTMFIHRHGSPLVLGFNETFIMVCSQIDALNENVSNYTCIKNNDLVLLEKNKKKVTFHSCNYKYNITNVQYQQLHLQTSPDPYEHWTLKEIHEQYDASIKAINRGSRLYKNVVKLGGLEEYKEQLKHVQNVILLGCGTSHNAANYALDFFHELCNFNTVYSYDANEFDEKYIPKQGTTCFILISQSGETRDVHKCIKIADDNNILTIGVTNVIDSQIAKDVHCGVYINAGKEVGVASTKTFTNQVIVLSLISCFLSQIQYHNKVKRMKVLEDLHNLSNDIKNTLQKCEEKCKIIADYLHETLYNKNQTLFILGKGNFTNIAHEGALKFKELTYINADGCNANSLRHGPYAVLKQGTPVIFLQSNDQCSKSNIEEVLSREADVLVIETDSINVPCKFNVHVEYNKSYCGLLYNIPLQFISYYTALLLNKNIDKPINLAKCVSV